MDSKFLKNLNTTNIKFQILYMAKKGTKPEKITRILKETLPKNRIPNLKVLFTFYLNFLHLQSYVLVDQNLD